jgi:hypothetical protein
MRYLLLVTFCILLILTACQPTHQPDTPRYTAGQVIAKAQAQYVGFSRSKQEFASNIDAEVSYRGNGVWRVEISVPKGYTLAIPGVPGEPTSRVLYFHESSGSFSSRTDKLNWP